MSEPFWLVVCGADDASGAHRLELGKYVIGRSRRCDIHIVHPSVSRMHAMLTRTTTGLTIRDLGSTNGTFVDGKRITEAEIGIGSVLDFGRLSVEVLDHKPDPQRCSDDQESTPPCSTPDEIDSALHTLKLPGTRNEVLKLLLQGLSEKQVAARLDRSPKTIHWHVKKIYSSMGVHTRAELFAYFRELNDQA